MREQILGGIRKNTFLQAAVLFLLFAGYLALIQYTSPSLVGNDGYYHIKMAYLMRTQGLKPDFVWLPLTILNPGGYVDHHFLFHILLIPFTFGNLAVGAKLASVLFASLAFLSIWWLLRQQQVPLPGLWSMALLGVSEAFLFRLSMPRTQSLSLTVLALGTNWLLQEKYGRVLILSFFYVWLYDAFPLMIVVAGVVSISRFLSSRQINFKPLVFVISGILLGLVINPYFPANLQFTLQHILPKLNDPTATPVGSEWYPYDTTQLIENSGLTFILLIASVFALGLDRERIHLGSLVSLSLTAIFGFMLFQSRRFIEYFPAFVVIFTAFSFAPHIERFLNPPQAARLPRSRGILVAALGGMLLAPMLWTTQQAARQTMAPANSADRYAAAAAWLERNSPQGSLVFQTDWDDFPQLFFYNHHNVFTVGLDPTYLQIADPQLYTLWVKITQGKVVQVADTIETDFGADFVFTDLQHNAFLEAARQDPRMVEVFRDQNTAVFQIISFP